MDKIKLLGLLLLIFIGNNYVEGQRLCHSCDSRVNPNCASLQDTSAIATITCGSCSQWIVGEATFRGCDESIPLPITQTYITCFVDFCNNRIFPLNRHKCRQCSSATDPRCDSMATDLPETACVNLRAIDECFTIVEDNGMTHRGCMSDAPTTPGRVACTANNNYCYKCSTSGCNTIAYSEPNPLSCVTCNSATNANCATEVNGTLSTRCGNTLLGRSTECYTYTDGATTIRGCTNDVVSPCNTPTPNCLTCRATNCNVEDYCLVCSTAQDENCRANTRSLVPQSCARNGAQKGCYRRELPGDVVQRGCASTLNTADFATCSSNSAECKICHGEACNMKEIFQTCFACDSRTYGNCARADSDTPQPTSVCDDYMDTCSVWILPEEGATLRGCSGGNENVLCTPTNPNCVQCEGSYCNRNVFPANRRRCLQCSGEASCQGSFAACDLLDPEASCYLVLNSQNQVVRGCTTDVTDGMDLCRAQGDRCVKCSGDNCNFDSDTVFSSMTCITCNSSLDEACAWGIEPNPTNSVRCVDRLPLGTFETCYVHTDRITNRIERGCRSSTEVACPSDQCAECTGFDCNNQNVVIQSCVQCRSSIFEESTCSEGEYSNQIPATPCTASLQPFETRGCYITTHNGHTVRGCLSDLEGRVLRDCLNGEGSCRPCQGQGCNILGGNGNTIQSFSFVTFITFIVVTINFLK